MHNDSFQLDFISDETKETLASGRGETFLLAALDLLQKLTAEGAREIDRLFIHLGFLESFDKPNQVREWDFSNPEAAYILRMTFPE